MYPVLRSLSKLPSCRNLFTSNVYGVFARAADTGDLAD
jgi:hypothetical protein